MKTLLDLLPLFIKRKNKKAFVYRTGVRRFMFTYLDLYNFSLQMASYLLAQGIKKGDRVAIFAPNSPFWAICYFGILLREAVVVPIDFASGRKRAETIVRLSGAKFIIQSSYKFDKVSPSVSSGLKTVMIEDLPFLIKSYDPIKNIPKVKSEGLAEIVYTSGTTADPKGVMLTHKNIVTNILQAVDHISIPSAFGHKAEYLNFLSVLPLSHMFEQTVGFLLPLYRGDTIVYLRVIKPSAILQAFEKENIHVMLVVPRFLMLLKNTIENEYESLGLASVLRLLLYFSENKKVGLKKLLFYPVHKKIGKSFLLFVSGGSPLPLDVAKFWQAMGFKVVEGYGLTECAPILSANTFEKQVLGSVGKPLKGVKIKFGHSELLAKGDNVFSGYFQNEKETKNAFTKDGWFKTGDLADVDKEGNIYIKGRKKDVIVRSSGVKVYPEEVEEVLNNIKGVKEACVIGLDKGEGEEVHAVFILKKEGANPKGLIWLANEKLDPLQQITSCSVWPEFDFPRTPTLKIQKYKVKEAVLSETKKEDLGSRDTLITLVSQVSRKGASEIKESSLLTSDLGMDSLARLELINFLEQEFHLDLEDSLINQHTTVSNLRNIIEQKEVLKKKPGLWFFPNRKLGRGIREFLDIFFQIPISNLFFDLRVKGSQNLKGIKSPVVFISNHVSYLDQPAIMFGLPKKWRYSTATAIREEFFFPEEGRNFLRKILFPYTLLAFNGFLLPQKSGFRSALSFMGKLIDHNINILVFPEGERTRNGKIGPFMQGLSLLVGELQVPIIPIRIIGMEKIFPRGVKFPKKGKCTVIFGKPLDFTLESPSQIIEKCRNAVLALGH